MERRCFGAGEGDEKDSSALEVGADGAGGFCRILPIVLSLNTLHAATRICASN